MRLNRTKQRKKNMTKQRKKNMTTFESDIVFGEKYREPRLEFEGIATSVHFYEHGCERVTLEFVKDGEIKNQSFDAPQLERVSDGSRPNKRGTGGPRYSPASRR